MNLRNKHNNRREEICFGEKESDLAASENYSKQFRCYLYKLVANIMKSVLKNEIKVILRRI